MRTSFRHILKNYLTNSTVAVGVPALLFYKSYIEASFFLSAVITALGIILVTNLGAFLMLLPVRTRTSKVIAVAGTILPALFLLLYEKEINDYRVDYLILLGSALCNLALNILFCIREIGLIKLDK